MSLVFGKIQSFKDSVGNGGKQIRRIEDPQRGFAFFVVS